MRKLLIALTLILSPLVHAESEDPRYDVFQYCSNVYKLMSAYDTYMHTKADYKKGYQVAINSPTSNPRLKRAGTDAVVMLDVYRSANPQRNMDDDVRMILSSCMNFKYKQALDGEGL